MLHLDVTQAHSRALQETGRIVQERAAIEAEIDVRFLGRDVCIVLRQLPWANAVAGESLASPGSFTKASMQLRDRFPECLTDLARLRLNAFEELGERAVSRVRSHRLLKPNVEAEPRPVRP